MKQNADLGWHIWSNDAPATGLGGVAFNQPATANAQNGTDFLHAVSTNTSPNIELLESSNRFGAKLGRTGDLYPIDAGSYTMLSYRLCASGGGTMARKTSGFTTTDTQSAGFIVYSPSDEDLGVGALGQLDLLPGGQTSPVHLGNVGTLDARAGGVRGDAFGRYALVLRRGPGGGQRGRDRSEPELGLDGWRDLAEHRRGPRTCVVRNARCAPGVLLEERAR